MGKDEPLAPTPRARGGHVDRRAIGGPMTMHAGLASGRRRAPTPRAGGGRGDRRAVGGAMTTHAGLARGRWRTLTLAEQLANAGADVGRAVRARQEGDQGRLDAALDRALELLDLTLADPRWKGPRLREVARTREGVCDFLVGDNLYRSTPA